MRDEVRFPPSPCARADLTRIRSTAAPCRLGRWLRCREKAFEEKLQSLVVCEKLSANRAMRGRDGLRVHIAAARQANVPMRGDVCSGMPRNFPSVVRMGLVVRKTCVGARCLRREALPSGRTVPESTSWRMASRALEAHRDSSAVRARARAELPDDDLVGRRRPAAGPGGKAVAGRVIHAPHVEGERTVARGFVAAVTARAGVLRDRHA